MIGYRNQNSTGHIITIEDPIEYVHKHEGCIITQRELGIDTDSWENALKNTLRQAPDVIMIGEVRTRETMEHAINFSETGHLCLCTLHANNANQAIDRIIHFFPEDRRQQLFMDLSLNLKGVVAQQLIPTPDGKARRVAMEVMLGTPLVQDYIRQGEVHKLKDVMKESDQPRHAHLRPEPVRAVPRRRDFSYEDALRHADSANEVRLRIKLSQGGDAHTLVAGPWRRAAGRAALILDGRGILDSSIRGGPDPAFVVIAAAQLPRGHTVTCPVTRACSGPSSPRPIFIAARIHQFRKGSHCAIGRAIPEMAGNRPGDPA